MRDGPDHILVGVDGSDPSLRAAAFAAGLARRQSSRLIVVFVHHPGAFEQYAVGVAADEARAEIVEGLRAEVLANSPRLGIEVQVIERTGDPAAEIASVAEQLQVDHVVVGASASAGHRIVGAIGTRLVKRGRFPVTVVP